MTEYKGLTDFVALDFETAKRTRESAIALGMVRYHGTEIIDSWYSLIRPPRLYVRPDFTAIHGLTVADVRDAPTFDALWESAILPFIGDTPIVAHNAHRFDMDVLRTVLAWYRLAIPPLPFFCSLTLARKVWPAFGSHSLPVLAKNFGIFYDAHNALADARTCGDIVNLAVAQYGCADVGTTLAHFGINLSRLT